MRIDLAGTILALAMVEQTPLDQLEDPDDIRRELEALEDDVGQIPVALKRANLGITAIVIGIALLWSFWSWLFWCWVGWLAVRYGVELWHPTLRRLYELRARAREIKEGQSSE